jgi:uncharacterized protein (DUF427 family)
MQMLLNSAIMRDEKCRMEPSPKWIRVMFAGKYVADSRNVQLLFSQKPPFPLYYFPLGDVKADYLKTSSHIEETSLGKARYWSVQVGDKVAENAAWNYPVAASEGPDLSGYICFDWDKMDAWFEEAEEVYVHPHDPHHRIDTLNGCSHIEVLVEGQRVADSRAPVVLFETGLPARYYFPKVDLRMDLLIPSDSTSRCAYKGTANYYSMKVGGKTIKDIAWYYRFTTIETSKIAGRIAFYNEHVDLYLDGVQQPRPRTPWS